MRVCREEMLLIYQLTGIYIFWTLPTIKFSFSFFKFYLFLFANLEHFFVPLQMNAFGVAAETW